MGYNFKNSDMERAQFWGLRLLIVIFHNSLNYGEVPISLEKEVTG